MTEFIKVEDFANVITGGTPATSKMEYWQGGEIPWLNSGELNQDIVTRSSNFITTEGLKNSAARLMPPDTVLIALTGATTGKIGFLTFEACANQSVTGILPSKRHFPKFLYYYLNSIRDRVLNDAYGGAQPHISQGYVKNLKIPLPPLDSQKRIATILDKADELRQNDKRILEKYEQLVQSVFLDMFGDPVNNPKGWKVMTGNQYCDSISVGVVVRPASYYVKIGVPALRSMNIRPNRIQLKDLVYFSAEDNKNILSKSIIKENDVLIVRTGQPGTAAVVPRSLDGSNCIDLIITRPNKTILNSFYFSHFFNTSGGKQLVLGSQRGQIQKHFNIGEVRKSKIPVPPLNLQNKFALIIKQIEKQKDLTEKSSIKSEELFQSLIQRAFKGELI